MEAKKWVLVGLLGVVVYMCAASVRDGAERRENWVDELTSGHPRCNFSTEDSTMTLAVSCPCPGGVLATFGKHFADVANRRGFTQIRCSDGAVLGL